jgi:ubiquinone/menaquinone biosynthesis C-methylase UbiE
MSLRGRQVIDRLKNKVSSWLKLPCPPYDNTKYWDEVYKTFGPNDAHEWGNATLKQHLLKYKYQILDPSNTEAPVLESTFSEAINVDPSETDKSILLLGCGNSKLGEDMAEHGWRGPLIQVDVVSRVLDTMAERCAPLVEQGVMDFVHDDATVLSAFDNKTIDAVIDKGLVDALFCADNFNQVHGVCNSAHRVLKNGGILLIFSLSQQEYLLPRVIQPDSTEVPRWKDIQVRQLESILMYRFQKNDETAKRCKGPTRESLQRKKKSKRR